MAKRRPTKYASIVPGLPDLPVKPDTQTKLDVYKEKYIKMYSGSLTAHNLLAIYTAARKNFEELSAQRSAAYFALEAAIQMLAESHIRQDAGWGTYGGSSNTLIAPSGTKVRIDVEPYALVIDKDANRIWAVAQGLERLLALPWATLNKHVKELLLAGQPEPPGVKTFKKRKIILTLAGETTGPDIEEWSPDDAVMDVPSPDDPF